MCHPYLFHSLKDPNYISSLWILKKLYSCCLWKELFASCDADTWFITVEREWQRIQAAWSNRKAHWYILCCTMRSHSSEIVRFQHQDRISQQNWGKGARQKIRTTKGEMDGCIFEWYNMWPFMSSSPAIPENTASYVSLHYILRVFLAALRTAALTSFIRRLFQHVTTLIKGDL